MSANSGYNRDRAVIAAVACPRCGARPGERCRNPVQHQNNRGPKDRRQPGQIRLNGGYQTEP